MSTGYSQPLAELNMQIALCMGWQLTPKPDSSVWALTPPDGGIVRQLSGREKIVRMAYEGGVIPRYTRDLNAAVELLKTIPQSKLVHNQYGWQVGWESAPGITAALLDRVPAHAIVRAFCRYHFIDCSALKEDNHGSR